MTVMSEIKKQKARGRDRNIRRRDGSTRGRREIPEEETNARASGDSSRSLDGLRKYHVKLYV